MCGSYAVSSLASERASGVSIFVLSRLRSRFCALARWPMPPTGPFWLPRFATFTRSLPSAL